VDASTAGGSLDFARLHGDLNGDTSGGSIRVIDCLGNLQIHTSGGGIDVQSGGGKLAGNTSGGSVVVKDFQGPATWKRAAGHYRRTGERRRGCLNLGRLHRRRSPLSHSRARQTFHIGRRGDRRVLNPMPSLSMPKPPVAASAARCP